jgi:lysozyme family protein
MRENFERCLTEVLRHEGLWSDHPDDPGGATMKGVTIGTFAGFKGRKVTKAELRAISDDDLRAIYRRKYWDVVRGDDLPPGLDLVAFDAAVNSAPRRGAQWLQAGVGVTADGKVGPETLAHARAANARLAIGRALDARLAFLKRLKTWPTFGRGWQRRVDDVRRVALEMAYAPVPVTTPTAKETRPEAPKVDAQSTTPKPAKPTLWQMIVQLFREN